MSIGSTEAKTTSESVTEPTVSPTVTNNRRYHPKTGRNLPRNSTNLLWGAKKPISFEHSVNQVCEMPLVIPEDLIHTLRGDLVF